MKVIHKDRLSEQELKYCWFVEWRGYSYVDAYVKAFKKENNGKARASATRLNKRPSIQMYRTKLKQQYIDKKLKDMTLKTSPIHQLDVIENIQRIGKEAEENKDFSPALQAQKLLGHTVGMFKDEKGSNQTQIPVINIQCNIPERPQIESKIVEILDESTIIKKTP